MISLIRYNASWMSFIRGIFLVSGTTEIIQIRHQSRRYEKAIVRDGFYASTTTQIKIAQVTLLRGIFVQSSSFGEYFQNSVEINWCSCTLYYENYIWNLNFRQTLFKKKIRFFMSTSTWLRFKHFAPEMNQGKLNVLLFQCQRRGNTDEP